MAKRSETATSAQRRAKPDGVAPVDVRRLIVELLAHQGPLTLRQLEDCVADRLKSKIKPMVEEDLQNLLSWGLIEHDKSPKKFAVSASGHRFLNGARALSTE